MTKIRVSNLAERLGLDTREVIARLKDIGVDAKTATSLVDEDVAKKLSSSPPRKAAPKRSGSPPTSSAAGPRLHR